MRDINITATCAHCGDVLDTNDAAKEDIISGLLESGLDLIIDEAHECFKTVDVQTDDEES